ATAAGWRGVREGIEVKLTRWDAPVSKAVAQAPARGGSASGEGPNVNWVREAGERRGSVAGHPPRPTRRDRGDGPARVPPGRSAASRATPLRAAGRQVAPLDQRRASALQRRPR